MDEDEITPEMIEAAAQVIVERCGDDRSTTAWARPIAEDALRAAFTAKRAEGLPTSDK